MEKQVEFMLVNNLLPHNFFNWRQMEFNWNFVGEISFEASIALEEILQSEPRSNKGMMYSDEKTKTWQGFLSVSI
jgi:hypothetical protein